MTPQPPRTVDLFVSGNWQPPRDGQYEPAAIVGVMIVLLTFGVAVAARAISRKFGYRTT